MAAAGLAFGLAATGMATAITLPLLAARHIPAGMSGTQAAAIIAGGGVATALAAALGVGVGAIIRNQVGAIVTVLALLYVAEPLLGFIPHVGTAVQKYGLAAWPPPPPTPPASPPPLSYSARSRPSSSSPPTPRRSCSPEPHCCGTATSPPDPPASHWRPGPANHRHAGPPVGKRRRKPGVLDHELHRSPHP